MEKQYNRLSIALHSRIVFQLKCQTTLTNCFLQLGLFMSFTSDTPNTWIINVIDFVCFLITCIEPYFQKRQSMFKRFKTFVCLGIHKCSKPANELVKMLNFAKCFELICINKYVSFTVIIKIFIKYSRNSVKVCILV
jgi:hypothetical protein